MLRKPKKSISRAFTPDEFDFKKLFDNDLNLNMFEMLRDKIIILVKL